MVRTGVRFALGLAAAFAVHGAVSAAPGLDERSIRGTWVLSVQGAAGVGPINALGAPPGTPIFAIGRVIFNGRGDCRSDDQLVIGNIAIPPLGPGETIPGRRVATDCFYRVEPDGYGVFFVTFPGADDAAPSTTTTARFLIESKDHIRLIADNAELGIYGGGVLTRQSGRGGSD